MDRALVGEHGVPGRSGEHHAICIRCHTINGAKMRPKMLYKLNTSFNLFPKFKMPVNAGRDDELGAVRGSENTTEKGCSTDGWSS